MPKSAAFIRIKAEVLETVAQVPSGRICTYAIIGRYLDVMARHVAYILATLTEEERTGVPWHRIVSEKGVINQTSHGCGKVQRKLLEAEGMTISAKGVVRNLTEFLWQPLDSKVN